jgi:hypothetical protein
MRNHQGRANRRDRRAINSRSSRDSASPCRHKISRHSQKLGHELLRAVWLDKGSSEFGLVTRNTRLQIRDLRLQHSYLRLESGGSCRLPAGGTGWFFSSHQWRP